MSRILDCRRGMPGYIRWLTFGGGSSQWDVYLDDQKQDRVVMADPECGVVLVQLIKDGCAYLVGGEVATEVRRGSVRVLCNGEEL